MAGPTFLNWMDIPIENTLTKTGVLDTLENALEDLVRIELDAEDNHAEHETEN